MADTLEFIATDELRALALECARHVPVVKPHEAGSLLACAPESRDMPILHRRPVPKPDRVAEDRQYDTLARQLWKKARDANPHFFSTETVGYDGKREMESRFRNALNGFVAGIAQEAGLAVPPNNTYFADCSQIRRSGG